MKVIPFAEIVGSALMSEKDPYQGSIGWYRYPGGPVGVDYSILNTAKNASCIIEIDGGVNLENGSLLAKAGAHALVAGSFVFNSDNPHETISRLKKL